MSFTDYSFIPTFLIFTIIYFALPMGRRWILLLIASILFFCTWGIELLPFAVLAVWLAWLAAIFIEREYERLDDKISDLVSKEKLSLQNDAKKKNRRILWFAAVVLLLLLIYTKTQRFLTGTVWGAQMVDFISTVYRYWIALLLKIPGINWFVKDTAAGNAAKGYSFFVPLGISYYTMSLIGYIADVYWRKERAEKNFAKLLLFALFFPKILEGPVSKHKDAAEQLKAGRPFDYRRYCFGWQRMLWGYFKKLIIADRVSIFVNTVFGNYGEHYGSELLAASVFGALQLYCDFSGCMDIALGASEALGITLEENFNRPFFSKNAAEFWRRWHITLGIWFKDYIYMPMGISPKLIKISGRLKKRFGKRAGNAFVKAVPLITVWLLTGLWHGTGWDYILWGIFWGVLILLSTLLEPELKALAGRLHINTETRGYALFQQIRTFLLFVTARILTIPDDLRISGTVLRSIFMNFAPGRLVDGSLYLSGLSRLDFYLVILAVIFLGFISAKQEKGIVIRQRIAELPVVARLALWLGAVFFVLFWGVYVPGYHSSSFIYMSY